MTDGLQAMKLAIVDYGLGNLFSIKNACGYVGMQAVITSDQQVIQDADAVLLPGVGAFGDAMEALSDLDLVTVLKYIADKSKPIIGVCLGMQLLMTESFEFGHHHGLGIIDGSVERISTPDTAGHHVKVPQIGWNRIYQRGSWADTPLEGLADGEFMYFVHSYVVKPMDANVIISLTRYGEEDFCSGLLRDNVFAFQFHPERSGLEGLKIYKNVRSILEKRRYSR